MQAISALFRFLFIAGILVSFITQKLFAATEELKLFYINRGKIIELDPAVKGTRDIISLTENAIYSSGSFGQQNMFPNDSKKIEKIKMNQQCLYIVYAKPHHLNLAAMPPGIPIVVNYLLIPLSEGLAVYITGDDGKEITSFNGFYEQAVDGHDNTPEMQTKLTMEWAEKLKNILRSMGQSVD